MTWAGVAQQAPGRSVLLVVAVGLPQWISGAVTLPGCTGRGRWSRAASSAWTGASTSEGFTCAYGWPSMVTMPLVAGDPQGPGKVVR